MRRTGCQTFFFYFLKSWRSAKSIAGTAQVNVVNGTYFGLLAELNETNIAVELVPGLMQRVQRDFVALRPAKRRSAMSDGSAFPMRHRRAAADTNRR